jgi:hypothetical protein
MVYPVTQYPDCTTILLLSTCHKVSRYTRNAQKYGLSAPIFTRLMNPQQHYNEFHQTQKIFVESRGTN